MKGSKLGQISRADKKTGFRRLGHICVTSFRVLFPNIWDPDHQKYISKLEMVQHRAAHFILGQTWSRHQTDTITAMLSIVKWPALYECRLTLLYKLCHLPSLSKSKTRYHHNFKYTHYQISIDNYKYGFFPRTAPDWNNLPAHIVYSDSLETSRDVEN